MICRLIGKLTLPVILILMIAGITGADSNREWYERINRNGITVWTRPVEGYQIDSYRAQSDFDYSIEDIYKHLTDLNGFPEWIQGLKEFEILADEEDFGDYYIVVSVPFSRDRDNVMRVSGRPPGNDGTAFLEHQALTSDRPERRNTVRVTDYHETWNLVKLTDSRTRATLEVLFDPGGNPPTQVVNWFVAQGPYEAFENMKKDLAN
jgi:hypothetical protein